MAAISYPLGVVQETTIEDDSSEPTLLCTHEASNTNGESSVTLVFSRGASTRDDQNNTSEVEQFGQSKQRQIYASENRAIAAYLSSLEMYGFEESEALASLENVESLDMEAYDEYRKSKGRKERARQLVDDSKERMRTIGSPLDQVVWKPPDDIEYEASWRSTSPSTDAIEVSEAILNRISQNTQSCYSTAFQALKEAKSEKVQYCEGLALSKHPGRASTHAWIEIDSEVVELTWPWNGIEPHQDTIYYGDSIDSGVVRETHRRRPTLSSVLLPDGAYYAYQDVRKALDR